MELLNSDFKKGWVRLKINDLEDLWYLSHLIDPGDLVKSITTRKIKVGTSENAQTVKKTFVLRIEAETVEFGAGGNALRINGKVKEGVDDVPQGSYHALSLEQGSEFTLEKVTWAAFQTQKLKEACERKYTYLLCLFDREEALFALTKKFGYEIILKLAGDVPKKGQLSTIKQDFYQEIITNLTAYAERYNPESIILASPAFYKDELFKKITEPSLRKKIILAICSDISERSLDEVIKRPELALALKNSRIRIEKMLMEELLSEISQEGLAVYGIAEVQKVVSSGAVSKLLVTDKLIQQTRVSGNFLELDQLLKAVSNLQGEIHIFSSENEEGRRLDGLGGIAAILRYKKWG